MSTSGGYHDACGGSKVTKAFQLILKTPMYEHPPMYS